MASISYDTTRDSLFHPGLAQNFFELGSIQNDAMLCAEMSRIAYVKEETDLATYLNKQGFQKNLAIGYDNLGTQVFIASNPTDKLTVVSFRGTEPNDFVDVLTNGKLILTPWSDIAGNSLGQVHQGFAKALLDNDVLAQVVDCVAPLAKSNRVLLTGHSLGAALATLTASWIEAEHLYTFGSCRVGNEAFAESTKNIKHSRFVDCCDIVTCLPTENFGYLHVGSLNYIDRNGQLLGSPSDTVIKVDRMQARIWYLFRFFRSRTLLPRELADHAPINYLSGVMGLRDQI
ncbi:MAG: lipase family protein [Methylobacter sp.]|nr:lipase family protein [Methylobacter sp.]